MYDELLSVSETAKLLGISPSTLRRLEKNGVVEGYGIKVIYTPGGQRRYMLEDVQQIFTQKGFSGQLGFGNKPALLIRDMTIAFTAPYSQLSIQLQDQIKFISQLIDRANELSIPVISSITYYDPAVPASRLWGIKFPSLQVLNPTSTWLDLHPDLKDKSFDLLYKTVYITDFHQSPILHFLQEKEIDTLILVGASTSGSIRATALDALQHGYRVVIPSEAVGDRSNALQTSALIDLNARYADVLNINLVLDYFTQMK